MLGPDERLLGYRRSSRGEVRLGAESFFFQEGDADIYRDARYALLRVAEDGSTVMTDLAGKTRTAIKPPR